MNDAPGTPVIRIGATGIALALFAAGCSAGTQYYGEFGDRLERFVDSAMTLDAAPGMAIAVVRGDETLFLGGFGFADLETRRAVDEETVFYIASSTKSFTGLAASILHERGEMDLDDPLAAYLPDVRLAEGLDPNEITLRDLLTHTHGIANIGPVTFRLAFSGDHTHDQLVALLENHAPAETGREFQYGNIGYNVAALAMDETLGIHWKDVLEREIFAPLGMRSTTGYVSRIDQDRLAMPYEPDPEGWTRLPYTKGDANMQSAGGLVTTASDAARWLRTQVSGGRLGTEQVLDAEAVVEAQRAQAAQDRSFGPFERTGYGLGWQTGAYDGDSFTHHFGGFAGFHAHFSFMPEHDIGVAILMNTSTPLLANLVATYVYDVLRGVPDVEATYAAELEAARDRATGLRDDIRAERERRASRPQDLPHPLEAYAGVYESRELGRFDLDLVDGRLEARIGLARSGVEVYDSERSILRVELTGGGSVVPVHFDDGAERATAIEWLGWRFERVR